MQSSRLEVARIRIQFCNPPLGAGLETMRTNGSCAVMNEATKEIDDEAWTQKRSGEKLFQDQNFKNSNNKRENWKFTTCGLGHWLFFRTHSLMSTASNCTNFLFYRWKKAYSMG